MLYLECNDQNYELCWADGLAIDLIFVRECILGYRECLVIEKGHHDSITFKSGLIGQCARAV